MGLRPLVAVGGKNFIDELISLAGGENIAGNAAQPWLNLPDEYVVAKAPQVIIQAGMGSDRGSRAKYWEISKSIPAVKEGRVYSYHPTRFSGPDRGSEKDWKKSPASCIRSAFAESKPGLNRRNGCEGSRP